MEALKIRGMTKSQLHQKSGVARSTIDTWKTQPRPPQPATVIAVADVLGIDRGEALRLAGVLPDTKAAAEGTIVDLSQVDTDVLIAEIRRRIPD
jgi:transcriptional regulator with XRE-family HTH domain